MRPAWGWWKFTTCRNHGPRRAGELPASLADKRFTLRFVLNPRLTRKAAAYAKTKARQGRRNTPDWKYGRARTTKEESELEPFQDETR